MSNPPEDKLWLPEGTLWRIVCTTLTIALVLGAIRWVLLIWGLY